MLECNYLTILLKQNYGKYVDTAEDVLDMGLTVMYYPGAEAFVVAYKNSPSPIIRTLAERTVVAKVIFWSIESFHFNFIFSWKDWDQSDEWIKDKVLDLGSAVVERGFLFYHRLDWAKDYGTKWYRSKDKKSGGASPFASFMMNKKWTFEEEFNNHMLRFQQVTVQ